VLGLICQSADSLPGPTRRSRYHIVWRCIDIRPGEYRRLLPGASSLQHVAGAKRQGGRSNDSRYRPLPSPTSPPSKASPYPCLPTLQYVPWLLGLLRLRGPVAQSGERRPRMAEVRGSSPLGSTLFFLLFAGKTKKARRSPGRYLGLLTATVLQPATVAHPPGRGSQDPSRCRDHLEYVHFQAPSSLGGS
jgi:hypothetical protein